MTWCVADLIDELTKMHPAMPVCFWNPEWIEACSVGGLDIVDGKVYLHMGWMPDRDDESVAPAATGGES